MKASENKKCAICGRLIDRGPVCQCLVCGRTFCSECMIDSTTVCPDCKDV